MIIWKIFSEHCSGLSRQNNSNIIHCNLTLVDAAIAIFSAKRCDPVLTSCQYESLKHFATLTQSKPPVLKSPFVTITNVVIEPVPLFNKAGDGCRPYVEVYQAKERVISTVQDYNRMKEWLSHPIYKFSNWANLNNEMFILKKDITTIYFHIHT